MALTYESAAPYRSVRKALRVLETVSRHSSGITEPAIAAATRLPRTEVAALLRMLRAEEYVRRLPDGGYVAGAYGGEPGRAVVRGRLQRQLERLRDTIGAAVYVSRYVDGEIRVTDVADGPGVPRVNEWVDFRSAAHASAIGKSLLSQLDVNGRRDHLARHRPARLTSRTITSERALFTRLEAHVPSVPVLDLQEYAVGTVCAAVPLTAGASANCLALSLSVEHAHRLHDAALALNRNATPVLLSLAL
ncbi:IclR family transcriptional regulator C-terminal domain-containing protein [Streptomyces albidoflavus]